MENDMARKTASRNRTARGAADDAAAGIADSAQKIWLAGLGAYERARSEGPKMFETLVQQGLSLGGKAREAADQALRNVRDGAASAGGRFDKLEQVFEERVQKSLGRLGVLTRAEVSDLAKQVQELTESVRAMNKAPGAKRPAKKRAAKARAKKAGAKKP
jgi:poly(hydroxyalkanoate) granule-associated protein